jgi:adenine-specific DNA-methyltransferase
MPELNWNGKEELLHPPVEFQKMPINAEDDVLIHGDNLPVMLNLCKSSYQIAYLDPPYNTGNKDWIYNDRSEEDAWLSWMWQRLHAVRDLLTDDGVIMISIGPDQYESLTLVCDEIFSRANKLETIVWKTKSSANNAQTISGVHEYILIYAKDLGALGKSGRLPWRLDRGQALKTLAYAETIKEESGREELLNKWYNRQIEDAQSEYIAQGLDTKIARARARAEWKGMLNYRHYDNEGVYYATDLSAPGARGQTYTVTDAEGTKYPSPSRGWAIREEVMRELIDKDLIHFSKDKNSQPKQPLRKLYLRDATAGVMNSVLDLPQRRATLHLEKDLGRKVAFPYPKPTELMQMLYTLASRPGDKILEPFAGSGSGIIALKGIENRKITAIEYSKDVLENVLLPRLSSQGISMSLLASEDPEAEEPGVSQ